MRVTLKITLPTLDPNQLLASSFVIISYYGHPSFLFNFTWNCWCSYNCIILTFCFILFVNIRVLLVVTCLRVVYFWYNRPFARLRIAVIFCVVSVIGAKACLFSLVGYRAPRNDGLWLSLTVKFNYSYKVINTVLRKTIGNCEALRVICFRKVALRLQLAHSYFVEKYVDLRSSTLLHFYSNWQGSWPGCFSRDKT